MKDAPLCRCAQWSVVGVDDADTRGAEHRVADHGREGAGTVAPVAPWAMLGEAR